jgi:hypothetical protein
MSSSGGWSHGVKAVVVGASVASMHMHTALFEENKNKNKKEKVTR